MKKLLFITYFWAPASKATIHWPLKIIKHLPQYGWSPSVLTVNDNYIESRDESLMTHVNPNLKTIKTKAWEPFTLYKKFTGKNSDKPLVDSEAMSSSSAGAKDRMSKWIRWNLFIPDARVGWYPHAVKAGLKELRENAYDAIVTLGPPHSTHLIGKTLSSKTGLPFIPILIDPWTDIVYYKSYKRSRIAIDVDKHFENNVLKQASHVVFVTNSTREDYVAKYSFIKNKSSVLYWGYNEEDFQNVKRTRENSNELVILHSGNIFDYQNPANLWKTLSTMKQEGKKIRIKFTGTVSPLIRSEITNNGLDTVTEYMGILPYKEMLQEVMNADVLLVCPSEKRHIPGKLFEYLRSGNPILAFNDDNPEVKEMIESAVSGMMLKYDDSASEFFRILDTFNPNPEIIKQYDRQNITKDFAVTLNSLFH